MMIRLLFVVGCVVLVMSAPVITNMQDLQDVDPWSDFNPDYSEYEYPESPYNIGPSRRGYEDRVNKRGFTSLSRWRPFNLGLGSLIGRYPPRAPLMSMLPGGIDFVSAETRGQRPTGQPLRWGR